MLTGIIVAALVVGCVGIILGFFLGISGEKFKVEVDPREEAILEVLPGNNCGVKKQSVPCLTQQVLSYSCTRTILHWHSARTSVMESVHKYTPD